MRPTPTVVQSYRDLIAWQKSMDLVSQIYRCTRSFPKEETYGLRSQLRRAAVSVPSNIAEGHARLTSGEFCQFLGHAMGSITEVETQILIAERLGYLKAGECSGLIASTNEIGKIVRGLLQSIDGRRKQQC